MTYEELFTGMQNQIKENDALIKMGIKYMKQQQKILKGYLARIEELEARIDNLSKEQK